MKVQLNEGCYIVNNAIKTSAARYAIQDSINAMVTDRKIPSVPRDKREHIKSAKKEYKRNKTLDTPLRQECIKKIASASIPKWGNIIVKFW